MTENNLNPEKTSVPADLPHSPLIDEMQALLHKFAEGESQKNESIASNQAAQNPEEPKEATEDAEPRKDSKSEIAELKALVAKLVEEKARNSHVDDDGDECDGNVEDDDDDDDYYWSPGPEWETIGYVAGGAALVGLGALLYHWLKD